MTENPPENRWILLDTRTERGISAEIPAGVAADCISGPFLRWGG